MTIVGSGAQPGAPCANRPFPIAISSSELSLWAASNGSDGVLWQRVVGQVVYRESVAVAQAGKRGNARYEEVILPRALQRSAGAR